MSEISAFLITNHLSKTDFLRSLAQRCHDQFGDQCDQLTVIFPNKRAGMYFAKYLSGQYSRPIWSPEIYSLEEYVEGKQGRRLTDDFHLNLLLYRCYAKLVPNAESFDAFMPWGEMIIQDFNDVDSYLVDPDHIFRVVRSQKELDEAFYFLSARDQEIVQQFWQGFLPTPSPKQSEFIKTWSVLHQLYVDFHALLDQEGLTYKGRMFRQFVDEIELQDNAVWFAGFNALTATEEKIIKAHLEKEGNDVFWDVDKYYLQDENQESGLFFRQYAQDRSFQASIDRDKVDALNGENKQVEVCAATMGSGQVMATMQTLEERVNKGQSIEDTLVVIADESLLENFLEKLPAGIKELNITMGWPVKKSKVFRWIRLLANTLAKKNREGFSAYTYDEVHQLLTFEQGMGQSSINLEQFKTDSLNVNKRYFKPDELIELAPSLSILDSTSVAEALDAMLARMHEIDSNELTDFDNATLVTVYQDLSRLRVYLDGEGSVLSHQSFCKIVEKMGNAGRIPLSGDIAHGLQVMGILETRNLSFDHVMIIGMNEDTWPKSASNSSFVPFNIRKAFGLPTLEHQDAMQSYLFYRLIQSAKDIWMTYNNVTQFNQNGELSRFVQQLDYESSIDIAFGQAAGTIAAGETQPICIDIDDHVSALLHVYTDPAQKQKLSPSALNTYLECRLRFYFQYVERLKEPNELVQDIDPALLGNLLHGTMEYLYAQRGVIDKSIIEQAEGKLDVALKAVFVEQKLSVRPDEPPVGRQAIAYEVVRRYAQQILKFDAAHDGFEIMDLEGQYDMTIPLANGKQVKLKGIIDRIDRIGEMVRIMDYKSGRDERKFKDVDSLFDRDNMDRNKAVFQLFYYAELYLQRTGVNVPVSVGLFNSKDLFDQDFDAQIYQSGRPKKVVASYQEYREAFVQGLQQLVAEIFDENIPFDQTLETKKCEYCPFKQVCARV